MPPRGQTNTQEPNFFPFRILGTIVEARCYLSVNEKYQHIVRIECFDLAAFQAAQNSRQRQVKSRAALGGGDSEGARLDD
jgi:hypothetical protein